MANINLFEEMLLERIRDKMDRVAGDDITREKAYRIATLLQARIKANIKGWTMIDSGRLWNSIGYKVSQNNDVTNIEYGSYGVKYAAMNEFGGAIDDRQKRAMFAALSRKGKTSKRGGKGVVVGNYWRPRPYIGPAAQDLKKRIMDILMGVV